MKLVRECLIRIDDVYDRLAVEAAGLDLGWRQVGNFPHEIPALVVVCEDRAHARIVIDALNSTACALRHKARKPAAQRSALRVAIRQMSDLLPGTRRNEIPEM